MRLLNVKTLDFKEFWADDIPPYIVASHRWGSDEPTFTTFESHRQRDSHGYQKIIGFCRTAQANSADTEWLWIDTCCIDKTNSVELSEAINSMFKWYRDAMLCVAYLEDIDDEHGDISRSAWFSRGWTLQELLAPALVVFRDRSWNRIGCKADPEASSIQKYHLLNKTISSATGIPEAILINFDSATKLSVESRMAWMAPRRTTRPEDMVYSLLGIFGVYMVPIYGEGLEHATLRFKKELESRGPALRSHTLSSNDRALLSGSDHAMQTAKTPPFHEVRGLPKDYNTKIRHTNNILPASAFQWQNDSDGRYYTVATDTYLKSYIMVYEDGNMNLELSYYLHPWDIFERSHRKAWRKSLREMWQSAGQPEVDFRGRIFIRMGQR